MRHHGEIPGWCNRFSHKPMPMYTRRVWEVIVDVDDQAVPLIYFYSWTRVQA